MGSFTCAATPFGGSDNIYQYPLPTWVPLSKAQQVRRLADLPALGQMTSLRGGNSSSYDDQVLRSLQPFPKDGVFPIYLVFFDTIHIVHPQDQIQPQQQGKWCIVHSDERERMERHLNGTTNPIHDLVHELRYNPRVGVSPEIGEAKQDFYKK